MNPIISDKGRNGGTLRPLQPIIDGAEAGIQSDVSKWVLVVDDDPDVLESVADFVAGLPVTPRLQVRTARSGPEAIERMARHFFDLIITDFGLGKMDGVSFLEVARQIEPGVPCVLMSGDPTRALERLEALQEENVLFLAKPFSPAVLASHSMDAVGWRPPGIGRQMVTGGNAAQNQLPSQSSEIGGPRQDARMGHTTGTPRSS